MMTRSRSRPARHGRFVRRGTGLLLAPLLAAGLPAPGSAQEGQQEPRTQEKESARALPAVQKMRLVSPDLRLPIMVDASGRIPTVRVPIAGGAPPPAGVEGELSPPPPIDPQARDLLLSSSGLRAAPVGARPGRLERPREFTLSGQRPFVQHAGGLLIRGVSTYRSESERELNEGRGFVTLGSSGSLELWFHADAGARYFLDFALEKHLPIVYELVTGSGTYRYSEDDARHHLVVATEPATRSGWATMTLSARVELPAGTPPVPIDLGDRFWTFYSVTLTRVE